MIGKYLEGVAPSSLKKASEYLSQTYAKGLGSSSIFDHDLGCLAYIAVRMPAIFEVVCKVLKELPVAPKSWLDLGAGPGTASWAAMTLFPESSSFTLIEKEHKAIELGKKLFGDRFSWIKGCLPIMELPIADCAIFSYSLGELRNPSTAIEHWFKAEIPYLVLIEPGTPKGFSVIRDARDQILSSGGHLIAPCPHALKCPLKANDWCHFSARVSRDPLHRYLKGGSLGYEDEKFSYLIASKHPIVKPAFSRILRRPEKHSGHVRLSLCKADGTSTDMAIGRSNKKLYKMAKDASWGDSFEV